MIRASSSVRKKVESKGGRVGEIRARETERYRKRARER